MTTQTSVADTIRRLASAQKPATPGSPPYSVLVNRRLGRVLAAVAFHSGLTPNQVSLISAGFTATGIALVALVPATGFTAVAVTLALVLGYGLDSADGQLARLRGGGSLAGEWLDHVLDAAKTSSFHLAVLLHWFRFYDVGDAWLLVPLAGTFVFAVLFFAMWLTERARRELGKPAPDAAGPVRVGPVRKALLLPTDYGVLTLVMLTLPFQPVFVTLYGVVVLGAGLFTAAALLKWFREITALCAVPPVGLPR